MKIVDLSITPCTQALKDPTWKFARARVSELEGWLLALTDEDGHRGLGYAHAIPAITMQGSGAEASLRYLAPMLRARRVDEIGAVMEEVDGALNDNASVKAAIDMALHDLLARRLGVPVHVLLGGRFRDAIPQSRILAIKSPAEMAAKAESLAAEGYSQLKLKLSGDTALDVARIAAVRQAVGPGPRLTLDPNQSYDAKQMMLAFSKMEPFDIALIEQPVPAADWGGLALLTRTLPVAVEADESARTVQDVFGLVTDRAVDVINLKVTKLGGLRPFVEAVRLCEAAGVGVRVGAAFGPALLQAMSTQAASIVRNLPFACELSEHLHLLDDPFTPLPVRNGSIAVSLLPGCGVERAT
jgi:L-alanine-DL-glutamate epimerase-like enolase superfamily enzyme